MENNTNWSRKEEYVKYRISLISGDKNLTRSSAISLLMELMDSIKRIETSTVKDEKNKKYILFMLRDAILEKKQMSLFENNVYENPI